MTNPGPKILLVEDNEDSRVLIKKVLGRYGMDVVECESGEEALTLARDLRPDLILMDLGLTGIDGFETTARLKKDPVTVDVSVVALTAYAMEGDRERILDAGFDGYIPKPIDVRTLGRTVEDYMKGTAGDAKRKDSDR